MLHPTSAVNPSSASSHATVGRSAIWYSVALAIFLADHAVKFWVHEYTPYAWSQPVTGFFNLVHVWNQGAAFSFLADAGGWQRFFFLIVALMVSAWLVWVLRKPHSTVDGLGYSLVLGGALGNGLDRAMRGYVVDFLDFHWQDWHWPAFNIADIGIVCGALLLVVSAFKRSGPDAS
ncbi:MAG: signal peptidase II [Burkholderiaceae bacterium]|nr:signal peptidase II [Burkholderiaceae bacterium]